jgi:CheY-like chemotaxis protein
MLEIESRFSEEKIRKNKTDIKIICSNKKTINYQIFTDQTRLSQIFYNLMSNALKFTNYGFIEFGYEIRNENNLYFYVKDSGIGIPKEKLDIIFERFRQVDESQNRSFGGSGLGLAISKNLVELLNGKIGVTSKQNIGTTFYFEIPNIIEKIIDDEKQTLNETIYPDWKNNKFLIVEDNSINFRLLKEIFAKTNAEIIWAENGLKSIEMCKTEKNIDLILMDIVLPDISGYEAFNRIREFSKNIPIIAQTALAMIEEKEKIENTGFDGYIIKPIKTNLLFEEINRVLKS